MVITENTFLDKKQIISFSYLISPDMYTTADPVLEVWEGVTIFEPLMHNFSDPLSSL